jgi:hypothetical protein
MVVRAVQLPLWLNREHSCTQGKIPGLFLSSRQSRCPSHPPPIFGLHEHKCISTLRATAVSWDLGCVVRTHSNYYWKLSPFPRVKAIAYAEHNFIAMFLLMQKDIREKKKQKLSKYIISILNSQSKGLKNYTETKNWDSWVGNRGLRTPVFGWRSTCIVTVILSRCRPGSTMTVCL